MPWRIRYLAGPTLPAQEYEKLSATARLNYTAFHIEQAKQDIVVKAMQDGLQGGRLTFRDWRITKRGRGDHPELEGFMRTPPWDGQDIYRMVVSVNAIWDGPIPDEASHPENFERIAELAE